MEFNRGGVEFNRDRVELNMDGMELNRVKLVLESSSLWKGIYCSSEWMRCLGAHKERGAGLEHISIINMQVLLIRKNTYFAARLVYILLSAFSSQQYIQY